MYPKRFEVSSPLTCPPARYGTVNLPISPVYNQPFTRTFFVSSSIVPIT